MLIFAQAGYEKMASTLRRNIKRCRIALHREAQFSNGERYIELNSDVRGKHCLLVGTLACPADNLVSFTLLAHTLKVQGARKITAILPYLAYARQDEKMPRRSVGIAWIGRMLRAAGVTRLVTLDIHSVAARKQLGIPTDVGSSVDYFAPIVRKNYTDASIVAPDDGAWPRARALQQASHNCQPIVVLHKRRIKSGITHISMEGKPAKRVVIIDDQLDTGATLLSACHRLRQAGVKEITIMVSHGIFTGKKWRGLWSAGVKNIYISDSVPFKPEIRNKRVHVVSAVPVLARTILGLYEQI